MTEDEGLLVVVTVEGPFGSVDHCSRPMRLSEAAMTAASLRRRVETGEALEVGWSDVRVMMNTGLRVVT